MTPEFAELEKASRRSAMLGGFGLCVVALSLAIATSLLHRATTRLAVQANELDTLHSQLALERGARADVATKYRESQLEIENLSDDVALKTAELTSAKTTLDDLIRRRTTRSARGGMSPAIDARAAMLARQAPVAIAEIARVQVSMTATDERVAGRPLYDIRLSLHLPQERLDGVLKVQYIVPDPSLPTRSKTSFESSNFFEVRYKGWRCAQAPKAIVFERDGAPSEVTFEICPFPESLAIGDSVHPEEAR
jgi:hypothetical protein